MRTLLRVFLVVFVLASFSAAHEPTDMKKPSFHFPTVDPDHKHMNLLLANAFRYIDPANKMTEPISGYPVEGWNQDPKKGLFLRSFTQLTAIGEWLEIMANIAAGYADNPYVSREQALAQVTHLVNSLLQDQNDPTVSDKGLLVNFLGLHDGKRLGPIGRDVKKQTFLDTFGNEKGEAIWQALKEAEWLDPKKDDLQGVVQRGKEYGSKHFDGPLKPFGDDATIHEIMSILDQRVVMVIFGDNANLAASVGKSIGALLRPEIKDKPAIAKLRAQMEQFLVNQKAGYADLYDKQTDTFMFGRDVTNNRFYGWENDKGDWLIGHMDYFVCEFRGPEIFVVLRYGLPRNAIINSGIKIKPYQMTDGSDRYTVAPWSGSAFQALGLSLFMQELNNPGWKTIMENAVDIELDYACRHKLPGFLSESYTGIGTQYTGDVGIPAIAVTKEDRITDAASLYTLGVAYSIAPEKMEQFLASNWPIISTLLTDHGPWEGYNITRKEVIQYQTAAHTLSFMLGALGTGADNMRRYLASKGLTDQLETLYTPGDAVDFLSEENHITAWTGDGSDIKVSRKKGSCHVIADRMRVGGVTCTVAAEHGVNISNGTLCIRYRSTSPTMQAIIRCNRKKDPSIAATTIPNEVFTRFQDTKGQEKEIQIPIPATPGFSAIKELAITMNGNGKSIPVNITFTGFTYVPHAYALDKRK